MIPIHDTFEGREPLIDVFLYLVLGMAVDLLNLGFELLALAPQFGNLLLGQLVPLFLDRARELLPVIFDMIPIHDTFEGREPLIDVFFYLVLGMAVDLLDLGFEVLSLALQFGNLFLGQLVPLFLDGGRKLSPVIFDMIPVHAILRFLLNSELSVNKAVQVALSAWAWAGAMEDCELAECAAP
jgi:hypothetical protein